MRKSFEPIWKQAQKISGQFVRMCNSKKGSFKKFDSESLGLRHRCLDFLLEFLF